MARPKKWRKIEYEPTSIYFTPDNFKSKMENILKLEEIEAIRLKDIEGLDQNVCAEKMEVSRATFQRILNEARRKIADSIVNGKAIRIGGGKSTKNICKAICLKCNSDWIESFENFAKIRQGTYECPTCGSKEVYCHKKGGRNCGGGECYRKRTGQLDK